MTLQPAAARTDTVPSEAEISLAEAVKLGAIDTEFYCRTFFPKTFRQAAPPYADMVWEPLENSSKRLVNLIMFRDSSKTTRVRAFCSKRIAYGTSRTILLIGPSEQHAILSLQWIRNAVDNNRTWAQTFQLSRGDKWSETLCEVKHGLFGHSIWITAAGIEGSLRGLNFDDYRPDLILIDDTIKDDNALSVEQNQKLSDLILSAVRNSLVPVADEPNAKMIMANTPRQQGDPSQMAARDEEWHTVVVPCWTRETMNLPVDEQISVWPERHPTEELRSQKRAAIKRNRLSLFTREKECRLISAETSQFKPNWIRIRDGAPPQGSFAILGIDPVPPPSEHQVKRGLQNKDYEAQYVWGRTNGEYHLLDFARNRGHEPNWSVATALALARKWRVARICVEAIAYQRVLKWLLEQEMKRRGTYFPVVPITDVRNKFTRIVGTISGLASQELLVVGPEHSVFLEQFEAYPNVEFDDDLDASAIALADLSNPYLERADRGAEDDNLEDFPFIARCP